VGESGEFLDSNYPLLQSSSTVSRAVLLDNLARPRATVKGKSYERVGAFVATIVVESQGALQRRLCKSQRVTVKLHPRH
jgi:hypothetical protein